ncbi:HDOD domain-containing protein [Phycisphaerales bacterium AB-hyl4]|uniref:histidine kinase n=1 Tax=Natronomicrosphaera hydrolytica TaxID=3242702 RepID=A0ABV4U8W2_9BACT
MVATQPSKPRRIELILRQIDSLPTLPAIATRLLSLTADDDSHAREVIELVAADPALTSKVLSLCRSAAHNVNEEVLTVERAVVLLGFNAIRNAVLSVKVFEMFAEGQAAAGSGQATAERMNGTAAADARSTQAEASQFNRVAFWQHSLAVGVTAELLAAGDAELKADEAFVCGLLHDIGKLAMDHVLPKSFSRVVELAELNQGNIAEYERRIVGIDHHTAGKRLAQQWNLPHRLMDCIWLHGSSYQALPRLPHCRLIGLIALADLIARRAHLGYSGNFNVNQDVDELAGLVGLSPAKVRDVSARVFDAVEERSRVLGLDETPSRELFQASIQRANEALGRMNHVLELRSRTAQSQGRVLEAITGFHGMAAPGRSVQDVQDAVATSARQVFGPGFYALLYPGDPETGSRASWLISQYGAGGGPARSQCVEAPPYAPDIGQLDVQQSVGLNLMGLLPWIADFLVEAEDIRKVKLMPLSCGWGTAAVLLHDRETMPAWSQLAALSSTWGSAIAAAAQHDGSRRMGEELAEANSALAEVQDRLLRQESMARLGEMAAGAAHEMNNPLAIISGRSQLLTMTLAPGTKQQQAAQTIFRESHRLSDLITAMHMLADPPTPQRQPTDLGAVLDAAIKKVRAQSGKADGGPAISLRLRQQLPVMHIDAEQIRLAMMELLFNAVQSNSKQLIDVVAQLEPGGQAVVVQVVDKGDGMDKRTLDHAMDPFFSAKPAGRRVGMGLPRAQQLVRGHGGQIELRSKVGEGTTATMSLPLGSVEG